MQVGLARLFYHMPKFGVLDECTSAVSTDVEGLLYGHAKDLGITLITISHRPSLLKYHDKLLRLSGEHGGWELTQIGTEAEMKSFEVRSFLASQPSQTLIEGSLCRKRSRSSRTSWPTSSRWRSDSSRSRPSWHRERPSRRVAYERTSREVAALVAECTLSLDGIHPRKPTIWSFASRRGGVHFVAEPGRDSRVRISRSASIDAAAPFELKTSTSF